MFLKLIILVICFSLGQSFSQSILKKDILNQSGVEIPKELLKLQNISIENVPRFLNSRLLLEEHVKEPHHGRSWRDIAEINGLKNEEVIVFVTSSVADNQRLLWERFCCLIILLIGYLTIADRVIPSARTWMRMFARTYVIVEDNFVIRYALRQCKHHDWKRYTTFECHNEPTYLLTRKCNADYYGADGPCCKVDAMFDYLINDNNELFHSIKYLFHGDDDTFFRADQLLNWLSVVDNSGIAHYPIVGNANPTKEDHGLWHINGCKEIRSTAWYQPLLFNKAAMEKIAIASAAYGLTDTCRAFEVTHDVGVELYVWFFCFYHIYIPNIALNPHHAGSAIFHPNQLVVHALKHDSDNCAAGKETMWSEKDRYDQRIVVGCGDIDHPGPFHNAKKVADMYDAWEYFRVHGENVTFGKEGQDEFERVNVTVYPNIPISSSNTSMQRVKVKVKEILPENVQIVNNTYKGNEVKEVVIPHLQFIDGYEKTRHSKQYDIIHKKWVPFKLTDCDPPGKIDRNRRKE